MVGILFLSVSPIWESENDFLSTGVSRHSGRWSAERRAEVERVARGGQVGGSHWAQSQQGVAWMGGGQRVNEGSPWRWIINERWLAGTVESNSQSTPALIPRSSPPPPPPPKPSPQTPCRLIPKDPHDTDHSLPVPSLLKDNWRQPTARHTQRFHSP